MDDLVLILYSRDGCCLCKGLEEKLRNLPLHCLKPSLKIHVIDIDGVGNESMRNSYDLLVPVMAISGLDLMPLLELPRVSPRIKADDLLNWLQKILSKYFGAS